MLPAVVIASLLARWWTAGPINSWLPQVAAAWVLLAGMKLFAALVIGRVFSSADGTRWTAEGSDTKRPLKAFASDGTRVVGVGDNGQMSVSTRPEIWKGQTRYPLDQFIPSVTAQEGFEGPLDDQAMILTAVACGRDRFVAVGPLVSLSCGSPVPAGSGLGGLLDGRCQQ